MDEETKKRNRKKFNQISEMGYKEMLESEFNNITKMLATTEAIFSELFLEVTRVDVTSAIDSGRMDDVIELSLKIDKALDGQQRGDILLALTFELAKHSAHVFDLMEEEGIGDGK